MTEIERLARELYERRVAERGPKWEQLSEVTKSVWCRIAWDELYGDLI